MGFSRGMMISWPGLSEGTSLRFSAMVLPVTVCQFIRKEIRRASGSEAASRGGTQERGEKTLPPYQFDLYT